MKKILVIKTMIIALCLGAIVNTSYGQLDADPAITSMSFGSSQIVLGHSTPLTVFFLNNGTFQSIIANSFHLQISLDQPGTYKANPESIAAITGTFASKFTWTYSAVNHVFFGLNNQAIAPGDGGTIIINITGYIETVAAPSICHIVRDNPAAYPNDDVSNNNLTATLAVTPGGPAPILLLDFNAVKQGSNVALSWHTSSEINSDHFDVQYSKDGSTWISIGTVAAAGNSSIQKSYSFLHTTPVPGANYYRLKQVDIGGAYVNSDIKVVSFNSTTGIKILPNPVVGRLYITSSTATTFTSVMVFTAEGKQLEQNNKFVSGNSIDMSRYPAGVYMIKITDSQGNTEVRSVVKER